MPESGHELLLHGHEGWVGSCLELGPGPVELVDLRVMLREGYLLTVSSSQSQTILTHNVEEMFAGMED